MSFRNYGDLPIDLGLVRPKLSEVFYYLYLPISLAGDYTYKLPHQLRCFTTLVNKIRCDEHKRFKYQHVYITAKRMYVGPGISANRGGYHSDGFMTDDLNYIWYDCLPTVFNCTRFTPPQHDTLSLKHFETYADSGLTCYYPNKHLLKLDQFVIHKVANPQQIMMRTFVKVSISQDEYNLKGNSINYDLDYSWGYVGRKPQRNQPSKEK